MSEISDERLAELAARQDLSNEMGGGYQLGWDIASALRELQRRRADAKYGPKEG